MLPPITLFEQIWFVEKCATDLYLISFRLSEEDLRGAVNELQYLCTYDEKRRYESDVLGENYGKKYPSFIIEDMKVRLCHVIQ